MAAGMRLRDAAAASAGATGDNTMPKKWNFLSNYGLVLTHLFQNPRAAVCEIGRGRALPERAVYQIVRDLEEGGFIEKKRVGRRNIYTINEGALFNYPIYGSLNVAQMSTALRRILEERRTEAPACPPLPDLDRRYPVAAAAAPEVVLHYPVARLPAHPKPAVLVKAGRVGVPPRPRLRLARRPGA